MQLDHLKKELEQNGYHRIPSNMDVISLYYRIEGTLAIGICLVDNRGQVLKENGLFETVMQKTEPLLKTKAEQVRVMALIVTDHMEWEKSRQSIPYPYWLVDTTLKQRIVFENQPTHFFGVEEIVEKVLEEPRIQNFNSHVKSRAWRNHIFSVNTLILVINVVLFIWMELSTQMEDLWLYRHGAIHVGAFIQNPQWWRLLASAFLHFSFSHLFGNMVVLWYMGNFLEQRIGSWRYLLFYVIVAVGANVISIIWYWYTYDWDVLTAGASGAIFGVVGMMAFIVICERGRVPGITIQQMILMVIFTLYTGFANGGVNNSAHVGGLVIGLLCGLIFYRGPVKNGQNHSWGVRQ